MIDKMKRLAQFQVENYTKNIPELFERYQELSVMLGYLTKKVIDPFATLEQPKTEKESPKKKGKKDPKKKKEVPVTLEDQAAKLGIHMCSKMHECNQYDRPTYF